MSSAYPETATIAGRYQVQQQLGRGSFGRTLLARDTQQDRAVAIKVLDQGAGSWKAYELFEREATVLRGLRHHGIPEVYDWLRAPWNGAEASFLVMEYVDGASLAQLIEQGRRLERAEAMHVLLELLSILEYIHGSVPPILHRDIKPSNIIIRPNGFPALVDFGSVRRIHLEPEETGSTIVGTYGYMPYEQYMGQASPSSDLYAVAATMLHVLTGRAPRDFMNADGRIEVPANLPGDARLRAVIARMLRASPTDRYASAHEVREALLAADAPGTQVVPARSTRMAAAIVLPPAPRALEGVTRAEFDRVSVSMWDLMSASQKQANLTSITDVLMFAFFSLITAGVLPMVFASMASQRKRRLEAFFRDGVQTTGEIFEMKLEPTAFGERITQVSYEFEADGQVWRDADQVLPIIANRWRVGDRIQLLYLPDENYDSVIISTS